MQGSKLNLESFLIMPVQRMPRYILLMRDMLKYTHAHHPDKVLLEKALEAVSATMANHNKEIDPKASDHAHKLLAVAGSIMNVDVLQQEKGISGGVRIDSYCALLIVSLYLCIALSRSLY